MAQWIAERPGLSREEFIDDIPFPETQNYVKRILSAADEYRRLYGDGAAVSKAGATSKKPAVSRTGKAPAKKKAPAKGGKKKA